jgi:3-hydroxyacyl-CoA dehydrogenase
MSVVTLENQQNIAVLTINNPPVNALSHSVREGLTDFMKLLEQDETVEAIIITCAGKTFIAGADITEFGKPMKEPLLPEVVNIIEDMKKPVIAAIHGTALGGGLEIALGCHYRISTESAKIGLPEVLLGLLPGAGGTQRFPRIAGVENALDAILSGRHISAKQAYEWSVIDKIINEDEVSLIDSACSFAKSKIAEGPRPTSKMVINAEKYDEAFFTAFRKSIARKTRGYFAPEQCVKAIEAAVNLPIELGLERERELFIECKENPQSKALQHMFFAERKARQIPGIDKNTPRRPVEKVGIIGAGTMGGGIAMNFANIGIPVTLLDTKTENLHHGLKVIRSNYERSIKSGSLNSKQVDDRMSLFKGSVDYNDLADCDLIIEAVFEKMDIKKQVFSKLDTIAKEGAILATNTSYLNINDIANMTKRPSDVIGLHFFSPANVMRLLEIIRADKTANDVLATCVDLAYRIKKVGVVAGVCHGFIGNRMVSKYGHIAAMCVIEGNDPQDVDVALYNFGMPMGPLTMFDMAGLDIGYMNRQAMGRDAYDTRAYDWINKLVEADRKGLKVAAGIYDYADGDRTPKPSIATQKIIDNERTRLKIVSKKRTADEIVELSVLSLINEGARILEEGIAYRASDIDLVYVNGYGFPAFLGGPMHYADSIGLDKVLKKLTKLSKVDPKTWQIAPLIEKLAMNGKTFSDLDQERSMLNC